MSTWFEPVRKDLMPPCGVCPDKKPGCHDHCAKEEYIQYLTLREMKHFEHVRQSTLMNDISEDWKLRKKRFPPHRK